MRLGRKEDSHTKRDRTGKRERYIFRQVSTDNELFARGWMKPLGNA